MTYKIDERLNENCDETCRADMVRNLDWAMESVRELLDLYREDPDASDYDLGSLREYGLEFSLDQPHPDAPADVFTFRWVLCTGGPHYEFTFEARRLGWYDYRLREVRFVFLPWFQHGEIILDGPQEALLESVFLEYFVENGFAERATSGHPHYYG